MNIASKSGSSSREEDLRFENERLRTRLEEAEHTLDAIRNGTVDALLVAGPNGDNVFTLKGSEHNYRLLVESIGEGAVTATSTGVILYCNARFGEMVKEPTETIIGRKLSDFVKREERQRVEAFFSQDFNLPAKEELTLIARGGSVVPTQFSLGPLDAEGIHGVGVVLTDLTETKMATQLRRAYQDLEQKVSELARSNAELARFAFVASHDLKEPLRVVSNYVQMLERLHYGKLDALSSKYMEFITVSVDRMYALIDDLLSYSRVGATTEKPKAIDLNKLIGEVLFNLNQSIKESEAKVTASELPTVIADQSHLIQLFQNLIANAIKYRGDKSPEITITSTHENRTWIFSVTDNGIGIPLFQGSCHLELVQ